MLSCELILAFLTQFLAGVMTPSLVQVLPRMIRGMIVVGVAGYAAAARGTDSKVPRSEIKSFYNLVRSKRFSVDALQSALVHLLCSQAASGRIKVAVDWTDVGDFKMLVFGVVIGRRTIPVFWRTIRWFENMVAAERAAFEAFNRLMAVWRYILIADRGFGNTKLLRWLRDEIKIPFVIRVKSGVGIRRVGGEHFVSLERVAYVRGRIQDFGPVDFTRSNTVPALRLVRLHDLEQREPWVLATSLDAPARTVVRIYGLRFLIEETFKDGKDTSNGFALGGSTIRDAERLSRMFGIWVIAYLVLMLVGVQGWKRGWQASYQSNSRPNELALFRLGRFVLLDKVRGPRITLGTLNQHLPALAFRTGHWDWKPRPLAVLTQWEILSEAPPRRRRSRRSVRTERPCDAELRLRLIELLKAKGIAQKELAGRLDRGPAHVSNVLLGQSGLPQSWIPVLMEVLGFTAIEELIGDTGWTRPSRKGSRSERVPAADSTPRRRRETAPATLAADSQQAEPSPEQPVECEPLGTKLKALLKAAGITQMQVAEAVHRAQPVVSTALNGKAPFPASWLPAICGLLNISEDALLDTKGPADPEHPEPAVIVGVDLAVLPEYQGADGEGASIADAPACMTTPVATDVRSQDAQPSPETVERQQRQRELKALLKAARVTQMQVAEAVHRRQGVVSRVLNGHTPLPPSWLPPICGLLGISEDALFGIAAPAAYEQPERSTVVCADVDTSAARPVMANDGEKEVSSDGQGGLEEQDAVPNPSCSPTVEVHEQTGHDQQDAAVEAEPPGRITQVEPDADVAELGSGTYPGRPPEVTEASTDSSSVARHCDRRHGSQKRSHPILLLGILLLLACGGRSLGASSHFWIERLPMVGTWLRLLSEHAGLNSPRWVDGKPGRRSEHLPPALMSAGSILESAGFPDGAAFGLVLGSTGSTRKHRAAGPRRTDLPRMRPRPPTVVGTVRDNARPPPSPG